MIAYGKGKRTLAIFREFFGAFSQASTEGAAWKTNRRITMYALFVSFCNIIYRSVERRSLVSIKTFDKQVARAMGEVGST